MRKIRIEPRTQRFNNRGLAAASLIVLLVGTAYYWLARPQGSAVFLALMPAPPLAWDLSSLGRWLGWLPTFAHVFAFSLITCLILGSRHKFFACTFWCGINALFELGQALPPRFVHLLPDFLNLRIYFINGVFDPLDLAACAVGALAAWMIPESGRLNKEKSIAR